jgi:uncharacterized protein (TIGR03085 family)
MTVSPGARERAAMCDTLDEVGASVPTLCAGWSSLELAAHLYVRERDPFAGPGIVLPGPFARVTERRMAAAKKKGYEALVRAVRQGPPLHWRLVPDGVHLVEYLVHHEDVRRAQGDDPRPIDDEREAALWDWLARGAGRFYARSVHGGLDARRPDGTRVRLRSGDPAVTIVGPATEVLLFLYGRKGAARLDFEGPPEAVARLRDTDFTI